MTETTSPLRIRPSPIYAADSEKRSVGDEINEYIAIFFAAPVPAQTISGATWTYLHR